MRYFYGSKWIGTSAGIQLYKRCVYLGRTQHLSFSPKMANMEQS